MWWRFLTFCVLVCIILFVVLSCIHGQPVLHLFFHRCCEDNIENDQVIFENFANNFLRERLIGDDSILTNDTEGFVLNHEVEEALELMKNKFNVRDPRSRAQVSVYELSDADQKIDITKDESKESKLNKQNKKTENDIPIVFEYEDDYEENDSQKSNEDATKITTKELPTTKTSQKPINSNTNTGNVETTTATIDNSLDDSVLSELDLEDSKEMTTKRGETDFRYKMKSLGIIK